MVFFHLRIVLWNDLHRKYWYHPRSDHTSFFSQAAPGRSKIIQPGFQIAAIDKKFILSLPVRPCCDRLCRVVHKILPYRYNPRPEISRYTVRTDDNK